MKKIYLLVFLCCSMLSFGQIRAVSKKVQELNSKSQPFKSYDLFSVNNDANRTAKYFTSATDVTVLNLNEVQLNKIVSDAPSFLAVSVPYQNEIVEVELYKNGVVTEGFTAKDEKGNLLDYKLGEYYRGIVKGDYESIVAISFFEGDVIGVISSTQFGNIVLGKSTDKQDFITYSDKNILGQMPFSCGVDELEANDHREAATYDPAMLSTTMTENCVKIYYEIAYQPYFRNGSDVQNTINWITGIQNNIGTLYANDNINVALHEVRVWTVDDPYNGSPGENLADFANSSPAFNSDLAHLVNYPTTTSVAYLNSLCTNSNYAYSGIAMTYQQVPTYSWTIMAMTHEMGHSLGSPHTHACAWNGDNTAIDGCGPAWGNNEGCNGPIPPEGGTIMSYCHGVSVGINFNLGFGPQPGALIRSTVDSKPCLSGDCSCMSTVSDVTISYPSPGQTLVQIVDETSTEWKYKIFPFGTTEPTEWQTTNSTSIDVSSLAPEVYYEILVSSVCDSGSASAIKSNVILTGDFCGGEQFTDTGGTTGNYSNGQNFIKTFYPSASGQAVSLNFTRIGLQTNSDYMYVHNGNSTESPLFEGGTINGNNNPGPTFTSTDASGAITVEFVSDGRGVAYGWEATIVCDSVLGIEDISNSKDITVYPNPTSSVLNIDAKKEIISVKLNDVSGKSILSKKSNALKETLNIQHLPKGIYILTVEMKNQTVTKKIIKN